MRPFGFGGSREGRDAKTAKVDPRLQETLDDYLIAEYRTRWSNARDWDGYHAHALDALSLAEPSLSELHALVMQNQECKIDDYKSLLGVFLSAGYQSLPEREIVYDLIMPSIERLGFLLAGKRLVIDGDAGSYAGERMCGELVVNGSVGDEAGHSMIGHLTINGTAGDDAGYDMIGVYTGGDPKEQPYLLGKHNGVWNIKPALRKRFLKIVDTMIASDLPHSWHAHLRMRTALKKTYSGAK
jgi:hypothetical protein